MRVVDGDLSQLDHGVAVTKGWSSDAGVHVGDKLLGARVVAVVRDAPDLYSDVIAPRVAGAGEVPRHRSRGSGSSTRVPPTSRAAEGDRRTGAHRDDWIDQVDQETRANNNLGLWILLGPAGFYAAIAIVNSVLVGASQRRAQLRSLALLGATREQLRRMALWEAGLVGAAALLVGGAVSAVVGWTIRSATSADVANQGFTLPWVPARRDRRHLRRPDARRGAGGESSGDSDSSQASAMVSARTVSGSSSLSP